MKGENEAKVVDTISRQIFPSAEILADKGAKHLAILRETINACWTNSEPFIYPPGAGSSSRSGPRPQPDFGLGFDRDSFDMEQLQKLQPFLGDVLNDYSLFAVTYQVYFPTSLHSFPVQGACTLALAHFRFGLTQSPFL